MNIALAKRVFTLNSNFLYMFLIIKVFHVISEYFKDKKLNLIQ